MSLGNQAHLLVPPHAQTASLSKSPARILQSTNDEWRLSPVYTMERFRILVMLDE